MKSLQNERRIHKEPGAGILSKNRKD